MTVSFHNKIYIGVIPKQGMKKFLFLIIFFLLVISVLAASGVILLIVDSVTGWLSTIGIKPGSNDVTTLSYSENTFVPGDEADLNFLFSPHVASAGGSVQDVLSRHHAIKWTRQTYNKEFCQGVAISYNLKINSIELQKGRNPLEHHVILYNGAEYRNGIVVTGYTSPSGQGDVNWWQGSVSEGSLSLPMKIRCEDPGNDDLLFRFSGSMTDIITTCYHKDRIGGWWTYNGNWPDDVVEGDLPFAVQCVAGEETSFTIRQDSDKNNQQYTSPTGRAYAGGAMNIFSFFGILAILGILLLVFLSWRRQN